MMRATKPALALLLCLTMRAQTAVERATRGECDAVSAELEKQFAKKDRLAGIALAQCRIAAKEFITAGPVVAALERDFPADPDVLYVAANYHMKAWNDSIYRMYQKAPASYRVDQLSAEVFETQGKFT